MTPDELQLLCRKFRDAMTAEDITGFYQHRVMNRLLYGDPEGYRHEPGPDETMVMMPGQMTGGGWITTDEQPAYSAMHPFPVEPQPDAPVFGNDFREIDPAFMDDETPHPLLSACRCGNQVIRKAPGDSWEHC